MESVIATREEVERFLSIPKPIVGSGFGSGSGDGNGFGYGSGFGYGFSSGSGDGNGIGYGSGFGSGSGDGNGDGNGGRDIKALNGNIVDYIDSVPTIITQVRGNIACGYIVKKDLTLEPCYIAKVGNSFAHGNTLKEAVADAEAKELENIPIEERINKFVEVFGHLNSIHTGKRFYEWHHILTGSCQMGRDEFCKAHNIDLKKDYTVRYFLEITKESYGSNVIKQVRESYKLMEE
ncbi:MAG: hypothetical protein PUK22_04730 [Bacteroides sp.]|nr:hypothetical protein [Bacteroides sp.]